MSVENNTSKGWIVVDEDGLVYYRGDSQEDCERFIKRHAKAVAEMGDWT